MVGEGWRWWWWWRCVRALKREGRHLVRDGPSSNHEILWYEHTSEKNMAMTRKKKKVKERTDERESTAWAYLLQIPCLRVVQDPICNNVTPVLRSVTSVERHIELAVLVKCQAVLYFEVLDTLSPHQQQSTHVHTQTSSAVRWGLWGCSSDAGCSMIDVDGKHRAHSPRWCTRVVDIIDIG